MTEMEEARRMQVRRVLSAEKDTNIREHALRIYSAMEKVHNLHDARYDLSLVISFAGLAALAGSGAIGRNDASHAGNIAAIGFIGVIVGIYMAVNRFLDLIWFEKRIKSAKQNVKKLVDSDLGAKASRAIIKASDEDALDLKLILDR